MRCEFLSDALDEGKISGAFSVQNRRFFDCTDLINRPNGKLIYHISDDTMMYAKGGVSYLKPQIFDEKFFNVSGETLDLHLIGVYEPDNGDLPFYWWNIVLKSNNTAVGKISLRLGHSYHSYYNGNIGYEIDEEYRGHHYALLACQMVLKIAKQHNMDKLYIACDYDNIASSRTIERLGAVLVEEVLPPEDYLYYDKEMVKQKIYELKITPGN